jgi:N-hydroxyarylamine O-acetyltransferase
MTIGRTHATVLLMHENRMYLIDTGFGGNFPLMPSRYPEKWCPPPNFRVKAVESEHGDYFFEMKLKQIDSDWRIGYAFHSKRPVSDVAKCNEIQTIIAKNEDSPFNKTPLITKLTDGGNITLTNSSFTQWENGQVTKSRIDDEMFTALLNRHFGMNVPNTLK